MAIVPDHVMTHVKVTAPVVVIAEVINREANSDIIYLNLPLILCTMVNKSNLTRGIYITTNVTCNLNCVYCYEKDKTSKETFSVEAAKSVLKTTLSTITPRGTLINFHGGEPFLSFEKIKTLCEWAWQQNFPEKFTFFATSNGTLIHGAIKDWLFEHRKEFIVSLSLDGTREMHNANRSNSFDKIDLDFFISAWPRQGVKVTVSPLTIHSLAEGIKFIHEIGFTDVRANLAQMTEWNINYKETYERQLNILSEYYLANPQIERCSLFKVPFHALKSKVIRKWCGAGTEMEAIDIDGKTYPCHLFFPSVCGKEKAQNCLDFTDYRNYTSSFCISCPFLAICPTCYGSNFIERGDICLRDMNLCELEKIRFKVVAQFEYKRIVESSYDLNALSIEERHKRLATLEGIELISDHLSAI